MGKRMSPMLTCVAHPSSNAERYLIISFSHVAFFEKKYHCNEVRLVIAWLVTAWVFSLWMHAAISGSVSQTTTQRASTSNERVEETVEGSGGEEGWGCKEICRRGCGGDPQSTRAGEGAGEETEQGEVKKISPNQTLYFVMWIIIHFFSSYFKLTWLLGLSTYLAARPHKGRAIHLQCCESVVSSGC